ncbi:IS66 family insertion sequence element accessory protein TnpB, partial [Sinorhizobium meliloti]|uniref:IS66 family insertion sequence element accessory protein TnpB n=1 Tax=Rhizobium meliloti TaxID=382 RepID=UPI0019137252
SCTFTKKLERGRFIWPNVEGGAVMISSAQLSYLLSGIDWRNPQQTWRPWGYEEFREALANKNHERHDELVEWWGSADYDPAAIDAANLRNNVDALATKWKRRSRKKA